MTPFKERMNLYRAYRELNPDKNYWDWKTSIKTKVLATLFGGVVPAMQGGGTVNDYITQQIEAVRRKAYQNSLDRTMPRVPYQGGLKNPISKEQFEADKAAKQASLLLQLASLPKEMNPATGQYYTSMLYKHVEDALAKLLAEVNESSYQDTHNGAILPSCMYTATDNYGAQYLLPSTAAFMQQAGKNGFRQIPIADVKRGDIVIRSENGQGHGMIFDGYDEQGRRLYNHSNGGHTAEAIRKHAKYPATDDMLRAYEFVGTAQDSARWINEFEKLQEVPAMWGGGNTEDYVGPQMDQYALQEAINQLGRDLYVADHTDPNTGVVSPFYNKKDDTYGTYLLPELTIKPKYKSAQQMERALNRAEGKRGEEYWHKGAQDATKFVGATVMAPLAATMFGVPAVASALDVVDVIADPFNPVSYLPYYNSSVGGRLFGAVKSGIKRSINKVRRNDDIDLDEIVSKLEVLAGKDPFAPDATPVSGEVKVDNARVAGLSGETAPRYLDYGNVEFLDLIGYRRPQWVRDVQEFYDIDVAARERAMASNEGYFYNLPSWRKRSELTFNDRRPVNVREYLDDVAFGGYSNRDEIVMVRDSGLEPDEVLVHEGAHWDQSNTYNDLPFDVMSQMPLSGNSFREHDLAYALGTLFEPKYKSFAQILLDDAYQFTEDFLRKHSIKANLEKGSTNRQMRYAIWKAAGKPNPAKLNETIDNMSDDDIIYQLTQANSYSMDWHKNILESGTDRKKAADAIRKALKYVPAVVPAVGVVSAAANSTEKEK